MTGGKGIVFVVDDDLAVRESLRFSLELEGLVVRVCATGMELLRHVDLPQAYCLVMDGRMPLMDGFEVLDLLAARKASFPVILLASHATADFRRRADAAGVRYVLEKPLLDNSLLDRIRDVLADSRQATRLPN